MFMKTFCEEFRCRYCSIRMSARKEDNGPFARCKWTLSADDKSIVQYNLAIDCVPIIFKRSLIYPLAPYLFCFASKWWSVSALQAVPHLRDVRASLQSGYFWAHQE